MIEVGRRVRDYEIVAHLKHGGMAQLFLARRVGPHGFARAVAIKIVHPHLACDEIVQMFLDEARLCSYIDHPNVVHVEELGEVDGTFFLAMEYLHGESLASLLAALARDERILPVEAAVWLAQGAAAGLHAAHETVDGEGRPLGVVHRDVSPQNVLVSQDGHVKLIDFGVAKMQDAAVATESGMLKGKLGYMAPEQANGEPVDRRTDVYALGIVLWEMLTMHRLFSGAHEGEILDRIRSPSIHAPSTVVPSVDEGLDEIVLRALARDPNDRFQTAAEMQAALARAHPEANASALASIVRGLLGERIEARRRLIGAPRPTEIENEATVLAPAREGRSLAVMPFRVHDEPERASLGEWLADDLRDVLSRVRGLRVKARTAPASELEEVSTYGGRLGVELVVTGRLHEDRGRVRLAVALTSVADGFQRWSERFDCASEQVFDISERIAHAIIEEVGISSLRGDARRSSDPESVALYAQLRQFAGNAAIGAQLPFEVIDRALSFAPRDPTMLTLAAMCLARETSRVDAPANLLGRAKQVAERAIDLAPELPEPWVAIGHVRYVTAEPTGGVVRALRRAIALGPSVADGHDLLGRVLSDVGLADEAARLLDHALWLDPTLLFALSERARLHAFAGEWEKAIALLDRLRQISPVRHAPIATRMSVWARRKLVDCSLEGTSPHMQHLLELTHRFFETGVVETEHSALLRAAADTFAPGTRPRRLYSELETESCILAGDRQGAIAAARRAVEHGLDDIAWFDECPLLDELRHDPELAEAIDLTRMRASEVRRAWDEW